MVETKKLYNKLSYWYKKIPEIHRNLEPLTLLMIRTAGESINYINTHASSKMTVVNSKNINLLHSVDRGPALTKLKNRVEFLKKNKTFLKEIEKEKGSIDLMSDFFLQSPFKSINSEEIAEIKKNKYVTLSGVGRICAIKMVFPEGLNIKIKVGKLDECLRNRLRSINNLYIYGLRFNNLSKLDEKEIIITKKSDTTKCYKRGKFVLRRQKGILSKIIPYI